MNSRNLRLYHNGVACRWRVVCCSNWLERLRGLLLRRHLPMGEAWCLAPCRAVHTFGMRFAIDVAFCKADGEIARLVARLRPFRAAAACGARVVYEFPAGAALALGLKLGDRLQCVTAAEAP